MKTYKIFIVKVNDKTLTASKENWNWQEVQESLKKTYGNDAVIEFVSESVYTDEDLKSLNL